MVKGKDGRAKLKRDADFSELDGEIPVNGADLSPDQASSDMEASGDEIVKELRLECEALRQEAKDNYEKYLRSLADFDNFKRRSLKDRSDLLKYQGESIFTDMLEVVDNFERALGSEDSEPPQFREGIELIHRQLVEVLSKYDVRGETSVGELFDPTKHSALSQIPVSDAEPGTVLSELKKAYFYKDKLIRVAEVTVAAALQASDDSENAGEGESDPG
jgi:molecular chaperone GrpE